MSTLTLKQVAKKIKAKGMLKLKHFCQLCQKQCRDDAGFRAHCQSESHLRQIALFDQNKKNFMNDYSQQFKQGFIDTLKTCYQTAKVSANKVYQDFIRDRQHIHMNSTVWSTLTEFIIHLGKEGICEVEETEKGWNLRYIKRDPKEQERIEKHLKNEDVDKSEEEKYLAQLHKQIEEAKKIEENLEAMKKEAAKQEEEENPSKAKNLPAENKPICISLSTKIGNTKGKEKIGVTSQKPKNESSSSSSASKPSITFDLNEPEVDEKKVQEEKKAQKRKISALEGILEENSRYTKKQKTS